MVTVTSFKYGVSFNCYVIAEGEQLDVGDCENVLTIDFFGDDILDIVTAMREGLVGNSRLLFTTEHPMVGGFLGETVSMDGRVLGVFMEEDNLMHVVAVLFDKPEIRQIGD
jgi:hypothetical protein